MAGIAELAPTNLVYAQRTHEQIVAEKGRKTHG